MFDDLTQLKRQPVETLLASLRGDSQHNSKESGVKLLQQAAAYGLGLRDFLTLAVDVRSGEHAERFARAQLNGYEATLDFLELPFRNDFEQGVVLQAASDTFQKFPGTRALFPEVIDDMLRWKDRQETFEKTSAFVSQSRTISGTELISTVVESDASERGTFTVPELSNIPVRTIRTSQSTVGMFKHGSAYRTSYEFNRRVSLDILTPFAARVAREMEISKVAAGTAVLINGDGVNAAAPTVTISSYGGIGANAMRTNYPALAKFLMYRAKIGNPVDLLLVNFDMYVELMFMFMPTSTNVSSPAKELISVGAPNIQLPIMGGTVSVALSSSVPAGRIVAFSKAETLEELVEAGASISENERSITNQSVIYVRTEVTGYKLAFGDTRAILDTTS